MSDYPPNLIRVTETVYGSLITLSDDSAVPISIHPDRLNESLLAFERPPLEELLSAKSLSVYVDHWTVAGEDWDRITAVLRASHVALNVLAEIPSVWENLAQPAAKCCSLPQLVYGGLDRALYLHHPFQFRPDSDRRPPWLYGLLSASGGRLFKTRVNPDTAQVEIECGVLPGHFIE